MTSIYDPHSFEGLRKELRIDPYLIKRLRIAYFKKQLSSQDAAQVLPPDIATSMLERCQFETLSLHKSFKSEADGASKLLFKTPEGYTIETVILRIDTGRTSICISSQVGCAAKCQFCATGQMGIAKSLTTDQIVDQFIQANQLLKDEGRSIRNVVFMGMGEPFHNEKNLHQALNLLTAKEFANLSPRHVVVSTVGIADAMVRLAEAYPDVRQALSLHSAHQATRERIIPLAKQYPLTDLRACIETLNRIQNDSIMIEYLMLKDINDTDEDIERLDEFCKGLDVHINLIPFNAVDGVPDLQRTPRARREAFANALKSRGYKTTLRYSLGADIEAACGQLVRKENRNVAIQSHPSQ